MSAQHVAYLSPDGAHWWDGASWVTGEPSAAFQPVRPWWDGAAWRWDAPTAVGAISTGALDGRHPGPLYTGILMPVQRRRPVAAGFTVAVAVTLGLGLLGGDRALLVIGAVMAAVVAVGAYVCSDCRLHLGWAFTLTPTMTMVLVALTSVAAAFGFIAGMEPGRDSTAFQVELAVGFAVGAVASVVLGTVVINVSRRLRGRGRTSAVPRP